MASVLTLKAPNQTKQRRSLLKICNSGDALYNENGLIICVQDMYWDYHVKIFEPTRMQHLTIDSKYQIIYQQTYLHSEMLDPNYILISFGVITNNKNDNHPT